jgi:hypothetical protein
VLSYRHQPESRVYNFCDCHVVLYFTKKCTLTLNVVGKCFCDLLLRVANTAPVSDVCVGTTERRRLEDTRMAWLLT